MRPARRRRRLLAALVLLAAAGGIVGGLLATRGGSSNPATQPALSVPAFVDRVETALEDSSSTRAAVGAAISDGLACKLAPHEAGTRIDRTTGARRRTLAGLRAIRPPSRGRQSLALLDQALERSIEADGHYRDGFLALPANARCPLPGNAGFRLASAADKRATSAKQRFVTAFDPLATEFGGRTWPAADF